jgi:hypothetical protein
MQVVVNLPENIPHGPMRRDPFTTANSYAIDMDKLRAVERLIEKVPYVTAMVQDITNRLHQPVSVQVKPANTPGDSVWTNDTINNVFNEQIRQVSASIITHWVTHGIAVYRYSYADETTATTRTPENTNISIVSLADCEIRWRYTQNYNIEFAAFFLNNASRSGEKVSLKKGGKEEGVGQVLQNEIPYSRVLRFSDLQIKESNFKSPVTQALEDIVSLREINALMKVGFFRKIFPLHVKKIGEPKLQLPVDTITPDILGIPSPLGNLPGMAPPSGIEVQEALERVVHSAYTRIITDADKSARRTFESIDAFSTLNPMAKTYERDLFKVATAFPLDPSYTLPPGLEIDKNSQTVDVPSWVLDMKKKHEATIAMVLGVPPNFENTGKFSASYEAMESTYHATIEKYRPNLQLIISDMFKDLYGVFFTEIASQLTVSDSLMNSPVVKLPKYSLGTQEKVAKEKKKKPEDIEKRSKYYKIELGFKHRLLIRRNISVSISFSASRIGSIDEVSKLHNLGYISMETAQQLAIGAARYPLNVHRKYTDAEYKEIDKYNFDVLTGKIQEEMVNLAENETPRSLKRQKPTEAVESKPKKTKPEESSKKKVENEDKSEKDE